MENEFNKTQREWFLENYPILQAKLSKAEYELELAHRQIEYLEGFLKEKSDIIKELIDNNDKILTLLDGK